MFRGQIDCAGREPSRYAGHHELRATEAKAFEIERLAGLNGRGINVVPVGDEVGKC
jgi:hypothetical protein